jgi:hypothetical protein
MSLGPFAWAALLTGLKSRVRYHGRQDKTRFAASHPLSPQCAAIPGKLRGSGASRRSGQPMHVAQKSPWFCDNDMHQTTT